MLNQSSLYGAINVAIAVATLIYAGDDRGLPKGSPPEVAVAQLIPTHESRVSGTIVLEQKEGHVHLTGVVTGLAPGRHGFHIHEYGDLRDAKGLAAGGHFNPTGAKHGAPDDDERHAGDLGNITANEQGTAKVDVRAEGLELHYVLGRSIVVHAEADDLESQPSGDAGDRVAVGVIGIAEKAELAPSRQ